MIGSHVHLIDGGKGIAKRAESLLEMNNIKNNQNKKGRNKYFTTLDPVKFSKVSSLLLRKRIKAQKVKI